MNAFIEVTVNANGKKTLINVAHIVQVIDNKIYLDDALANDTDYDKVTCAENYNKILEKISEAVNNG